MERMEGLLFDASIQGNLTVLLMLLQEDPLILDRVSENSYDDMPLHVASMLGHFDFVNEIVNRKPQLATESDSQRRLPLHLASAKGHVEIVKKLVLTHPDTCLARDRYGRNPLHLAAIKGRHEVVKELLQAQPHAARAMVQQETILHLCVKHNQLEVLKLLVESMGHDHEFVNSKDADGNTILHLAVIDKQSETINFLLLDTTVEVNASNTNGDTAMNILAQRPKDEKDQQIIRSLMRAGATEGKIEDLFGKIPQNWRSKMGLKHYKELSPASDIIKKKEDWLDKARNTLMVVASLVATMAFQAGINPPGGVWQQDDSTANPPHIAGCAVMAHKRPDLHHVFLVSNSLGFASTLSIILLLISGLPLIKKHRVFTWIMMIIMWIAAASMSVTYIVSIWALTPKPRTKTFEIFVAGIVGLWIVLAIFLVVGHIINVLVQFIKKLLKCITYRRIS